MTDFRIGLFYPTNPNMHFMSPLVKELNPDVRVVATHVELMRTAEAVGFDYVFLADQWGDDNRPVSHELGVEWDVWMMGATLAGLLMGASEKIKVITTMHQAWLHPVQIARMGGNLDSLSSGRWGMNAVSGVGFGPELLKSITPITNHGEFYASATESMEIIHQAWENDGNIDFQGEYFQAKGRLNGPMPVQKPHPKIVSAGSSPAGCEFAGRFADFVFIPGEASHDLIREKRKMITEAAERAGREDVDEIKVLLNASLVLSETQEQADQLTTELLETVDPRVMEEHDRGVSATSETYKGLFEKRAQEMALPVDQRSHTLGMVSDWVSGDAELVADTIQEVYESGVCEGISFSFAVRQPTVVELFGSQVAPLLEERGIWSSAAKRGWPW